MKYNMTREQLESDGIVGAHYESLDNGYQKTWVLNDFWLYVWGKDESVSPSLKGLGYWEAWITSWFTRWVRPGMTVLDIGAHCGYYTMLNERLVGPYGEVVAFEPNPIYTTSLAMTRAANNANFTIRPVALGDTTDTVPLHIPEGLTGSAGIGLDLSAYNEKVTMVEQSYLDWEFGVNDFGPPHIIKIDAEGYEQKIWEGGRRLWNNQHHTTLVMEWTPGAYTPEFYDELSEWGEVTLIGFDGIEQPVSRDYLYSASDWQMIVVRKI